MSSSISGAVESEGRIQKEYRLLRVALGFAEQRATAYVMSLWSALSIGFWWGLIGSFFIVAGISVIFSGLRNFFIYLFG
ncbi:MAG: hypothetical protein V4598_05625 [Bdellovibrionota bacterium]